MEAKQTAGSLPARFLRRARRDFKSNLRQMKKHRVHYLLVAPFAILFITFTVIPVLMAMGLSFTYFNVLEPPRFIGLQNYFTMFFSDDIFLISLKNTLLFAVLTGPAGYLLCLLLAWLLNEVSRAQRTVLTLLFYAPSISGNMYMIWALLFSGDSYGYINGLLMKLGLISTPIQFLQDERYIKIVVIVAVMWMSLGTSFLSFIAGLQGIDRQYYEAGAIDGVRNRWQELWFITLPMMKPQLMFGAVMSITSAFGIGDVVTNLVGFPSVNYSANTLALHLNDYGNIRMKMGYACAIAVVLFAMMVLSNKLIQKLLSRVGT